MEDGLVGNTSGYPGNRVSSSGDETDSAESEPEEPIEGEGAEPGYEPEGDNDTLHGGNSGVATQGETSYSISRLHEHFVPAVDDLKTSMDFTEGLEVASLGNGELDDATLARLRNPPCKFLEIVDPNGRYSLMQFLATQGSSQDTYRAICVNHNSRYPDQPMLSYERVLAKVAE